MMLTVEFDNEFFHTTDKVTNECSNRYLAAELETIQLFTAQLLPQQPLCIGRGVA